MKLTYRGAEYDHNPPMLELTDTDIVCNYRSRTHRYSYVRHVPFSQQQTDLAYRGAAYCIDCQGRRHFAVKPESESILSAFQRKLAELTPLMNERRRVLRQSAHNHSESIQRSLVHRIEVARVQGNAQLLQQLEDEMRQMA